MEREDVSYGYIGIDAAGFNVPLNTLFRTHDENTTRQYRSMQRRAALWRDWVSVEDQVLLELTKWTGQLW